MVVSYHMEIPDLKAFYLIKGRIKLHEEFQILLKHKYQCASILTCRKLTEKETAAHLLASSSLEQLLPLALKGFRHSGAR